MNTVLILKCNFGGLIIYETFEVGYYLVLQTYIETRFACNRSRLKEHVPDDVLCSKHTKDRLKSKVCIS